MVKSSKSSSSSNTLVFDNGAIQFRQRLVLSILSHRTILIRNIRSDDLESPGLRDHEVSFLKLLDQATNGTRIEINSTGTQIKMKPGVLVNGYIEHACPLSRSVGYFLEGILPLAAFGKEPLQLKLQGVTDGMCHLDPSPDYLQKSAISLLEKFIGSDLDSDVVQLGISIQKRGAAPLGGGVVEFSCPIVKELQPIDLCEEGKINRIRGICVANNIPASSSARASHASKGLLLRLIPDVWIHTSNHYSKTFKSPSLSICLTAESTSDTSLSAETCFSESKQLPEDLGIEASAKLLQEVQRGGCIDSGIQSLALLLMCCTTEDVSRIRLGTLSQYTMESLRLYKQALGVEFKVTPDHTTQTVLLSCLGMGFTNMAKKST